MTVRPRFRLARRALLAAAASSRANRGIVRVAVAAVVVAAGSVAAAAAISPAASAASTLVVEANSPYRTVTHVATGSLYGLATASVPADSLVEPLHPNTFVQMAAGGKQQAAGDVLVVAPEAAKAGARLVDRMSDFYAGWPYRYSASTWPGIVQTQVNDFKSSAYASRTNIAIWNEPDNTWLSSNGSFNSFWATTYKQVRSLWPSAVIQGPSFSDNISGMPSFLQNAVATSTVPDVIAWHELESAGKIAGDVSTVTAEEKSLGITPRPIAIEEYAAPSQVGIPGDLVDYIAQFERLGINNAELAFWNQYGALGDLLTGTGGSPNAAYWLYRWYGQMSGNMVTVVPPGTAGTGLDGAASINSAGNQVSVIFGGGSGSTAVTVSGLGSAFGSTAHAVLEQTVSAGRTSAVVGPSVISSGNYTISGGSITVPISSMNSANGYHLVVTPGTSAPLSGTLVIKNVHSGLALDTSGGGTGQGTLAVQATVNGSSSTQKWTLVSEGSNYYEIKNSASGLLLGISGESINAGGDALIWGNNGSSDHVWQIVSAGSGQYKIVNSNSGLLLGVSGESTSPGAQVLQWSDNGTPDHLWTLTTS